MKGRVLLALLLAAGAAASYPKETHSALEGYASDLAEANHALHAPSEETLRQKRGDSDRRFKSLKHLAKNLAAIKASSVDTEVHTTRQELSASAAISSTGHHAGEERLEASARKWQLRKAEADKPSGKSVTHRANAKSSGEAKVDDSRSVARAANEGAEDLKAKLKDHIDSMHSALHATEKEIEGKLRAKTLNQERDELRRKRLAAEERKKAAEMRTKDAEQEALRAKAIINNKKFEEQKAKNELERTKKQADEVAHEKMVAYRIAQAEASAKEAAEKAEAAKKAEAATQAAEIEVAEEAEEVIRAARAQKAVEAETAARKSERSSAVNSSGAILVSMLFAALAL